jgi:hypothetical protein
MYEGYSLPNIQVLLVFLTVLAASFLSVPPTTPLASAIFTVAIHYAHAH